MAARKVLTRAESQAQTRESLIDAAEQLFLADGYHTTSIAAIAAEAGRTIGAVYSNFDSKESLCIEVIRRRATAELTKLTSSFVAAPDDLEARLAVVPAWWSRVSGDTAMITLFAEFLITALRDARHRASSVENFNSVLESARILLIDYLPDEISADDPLLDAAVHAVIATGTGLAVARAAEVITAEQSSEILGTTIRLWLGRLAGSASDLPAH
ncbi:TetR/AcrR family transcriptional regulator [Nocardia cyriacigeorgica]|uniref:TetR/AcrR family transcriptional regulator n=1 Tax=Nocardia cyriacigeorgica TaxID=135487 RepID=A0A5R8P903_9NOCA|nr:TetR/AcrR family transcriptional regulator [Nocardia cyriacigeorgica]TLG00349.1 TetR/AcrR family transcriptional regulator [Nocardia cyriacigeorgica]